MAAHYELEVEGGKEAIVKLRLTNSAIFSEKLSPFGEYFDIIFKDRIREADEFYDGLLHTNLSQQEVAISRQAYASEYPAYWQQCCHTEFIIGVIGLKHSFISTYKYGFSY